MSLLSKIGSGSATVGIIGLGYVGLPLLHAFHRAGFPVIGFDVDAKKIDALKAGRNYLKHLGEGMVKEMLAGGRFDATPDFARLAECDAIIVASPRRWASMTLSPLFQRFAVGSSARHRNSDIVAATLNTWSFTGALDSGEFALTISE